MDVMDDDDLARIPVKRWAASTATLALWATWPKFDVALRVLHAWGFRYVTGFPWVKTTPDGREVKTGVGFWTMNTSEALLIGVRGAPRREKGAPVHGLALDGDGEERVLWSPKGPHSRKPEAVHAWLERLFPNARRLELFARRRRPGWTTWGKDTGFTLMPAGVVATPETVTEANRQGSLFAEVPS